MREEIVGNAERHLAAPVQFLNDGVILGVILKAAARVDDAREAEAIQFPHEVPRGVHLMFRRQLRSFGKCRVENRRVRTRDEQPGRIASIVALNFSARGVGCVLRVTAGPQRRLVQQRAAIQMQNEDRRIGRSEVDFLQRRHPAFGELKFAPATHHTHPLTCWCAFGLLLEQSQSIRERRHTVPAELHVVVEAAADDVQVRIVEAGNDAAIVEVNCQRVWTASHLRVIYANDAAVCNGKACGFRMFRIERGDLSVVKN